MTEYNRPQQGAAPQERSDNQQARRGSAQPWDYERHLEAEHNLLVGVEEGWPTGVKRYRLYRPMQGKTPERTLLTFIGTGPLALSRFFDYIHPSPAPVTTQRPFAGRRN